MNAEGWAQSHVCTWGSPPDEWHAGTVVGCVLWVLEIVQGEGDRGVPAPWQEVLQPPGAAPASTSLLPLLFAASSPRWGACGRGTRN